MTPLWREAIRPLLAARNPAQLKERDILARARCFDLREVQELARTTSSELRLGAEFERVEGGGEFAVDIGERVCVPAPVTWLEFGSLGVLIDDKHVVNYQVLSGSNGKREIRPGLLGILAVDDGIATVFRAEDPTQLDFSRWTEEYGVGVLFLALAGLAIIGSPACRPTPVAAHRGLARDLRRVAGGQDREITHTKVTIKEYVSTGGQGSGQGSPKALHFCRAHVRQRVNGNTERVRAHWRGDPAFGIRLPTYEVPALQARQAKEA